MAKTRSMTRERKRLKTSEDGGSASWSNLTHDLLFTVIMQLNIIDFVAFSGVCTDWRLFAHSVWKRYMVSRQPMFISISTRTNKKKCFLEDFDGKLFKTNIPHSTNRTCVGLTFGYLILWGKITRDFWLVNPITRHELHFPDFPYNLSIDPAYIRGIIVYSHSLSQWVFLIAHRCSFRISFCLAGKQASWDCIFSKVPILDIHAFKGKIYLINFCMHFFEVRLDQLPNLTPLRLKNFVKVDLSRIQFLSSGENFFVVGFNAEKVYKGFQVDVDKRKWVSSGDALLETVMFLSGFGCASAAIKPSTWAHPPTQDNWRSYYRTGYYHTADESKRRGRGYTKYMWYIPHDCLNAKLALTGIIQD